MIITDLIRTNWLRSVLLMIKVRYSVLLALQTLTTIRPIRPHTRHIILTCQYLHLLSCYVPLGHAVYKKCGENNDNPSNSPPGGGGGLLAYITYTGMCRPTGSWFWCSWFRTGYPFQRRFLERGTENCGSGLYLLPKIVVDYEEAFIWCNSNK